MTKVRTYFVNTRKMRMFLNSFLDNTSRNLLYFFLYFEKKNIDNYIK